MLFNKICFHVYVQNITNWRYIQNNALMRPISDSANTKRVDTLAKKEASNAKLAIQN